MIETKAILTALLLHPQYFGDRADPPEARPLLLEPVAAAIAIAARGSRYRAARLMALGRMESGWAAYVVEDRCLDGPVGQRCDYDHRTKQPRATSPWQLHRSACPAAWAAPANSLARLVASARCADRLLDSAKRRCAGVHPAGDEAGMFAGYRGVACIWSGGAKRAPQVAVELGRLAKIEAKLRT